MRRTNIYLDDRQLSLLRRLGAQRNESLAGLVRAAIDDWLDRQGARLISEDEWQQRFTSLLERRGAAAVTADEEQVAADVADAVAEVRARRR